MRKLLLACAVLALSSPALAQNDSTMPPDQSAPADQAAPDQATPDQGTTAATPDMAGEPLYNSDGEHIGRILRMTTTAEGQKMAVVEMAQHLGIGGQQVLFPISQLQPREKGGYMTTLSGDQMKQLPRSNATNSP